MSTSNQLDMNSSQNLGMLSPFWEQARLAAAGHRDQDYLAFRSFGVHFELSASEAKLLQEALTYLPLESKRCVSILAGPRYSLVRSSTASESDKTTHRLYRDGRRLFTCGDRRELLECFGSIVSLYVAEASLKRTFVHAGVVGWGRAAILIPGRSFSGKTSLVAALVRAGATYYSDEFAVVDKRGMVHPYARPLQVRENGSYRQTRRVVEEIGGVAGKRPLPVGLVIVSRYKPGARWAPRQLSPGIGLLKILDNTVSARRSPAIALSTLKQLVSDAIIVKGIRGEVAQVVDWIAARCGPLHGHSESRE
jgi:hypothetical protein